MVHRPLAVPGLMFALHENNSLELQAMKYRGFVSLWEKLDWCLYKGIILAGITHLVSIKKNELYTPLTFSSAHKISENNVRHKLPEWLQN